MGKIIIFALIISFSLCFPGRCFAQGPQMPQNQEEQMKNMQEQMKKMEEMRKKTEQNYLASIKETNPQMYDKRIRETKAREKMDKILNDFRQQKISFDSAKTLLYPLVKESLRDRISSLDTEIERAVKKVETLKKARREPSYLVNKEVDRMLGAPVSPDEFMP